MSKQFLFVVLAVLSTQLALAQQIYQWKDEEGRWHYSDLPPSGVTAEKVETDGDTAQKLVSQPGSSAAEQKKAEDSSGRSTQGAADVDLLGAASRRLLVFPPSDPDKPLSEWIPVESFTSVEECARARALHIAGSMVQSTEFSSEGFRETTRTADSRRLSSRCISLAEFKPSKKANVVVAVTKLGPDPGGFSTWLLYGRVFNGGQTIAKNVVVRYRARDARGIIYADGEILPAPQDVPPLTFAEYRVQILGSLGGSDRWVETEARWSND
jgi:Domain of unknown function (DUF4124)